MLSTLMMDKRAYLFALTMLFVVKVVDGTVTPNVTTPIVTTLTAAKTAPSAAKGDTSKDPVTTVTIATTTTAPLSCKVGSCTGSDACLGSKTTIKLQTCNTGEICELIRRDINGTTGEYTFSCAARCLAQNETVACCSESNCIPTFKSGSTPSPNGVAAMVCFGIAALLLI